MSELKPCGTIAAARRHQKAREPMCDLCRAAWSKKNAADYLARRKARR